MAFECRPDKGPYAAFSGRWRILCISRSFEATGGRTAALAALSMTLQRIAGYHASATLARAEAFP
eukprot:CAMPEP_0170185806 /NCGR_PEP_ID=MMETSP0040_2-20121228/37512_1 /TAXON_ID=641309 /ORGANISM="Lotharella oceanica, Strain CCMP622" /LENGTH=64 /DNA_ID=CAMNT_0010432323 /DNA_START=25 /DNA_END=219 /DNA_ORIENTATION=+